MSCFSPIVARCFFLYIFVIKSLTIDFLFILLTSNDNRYFSFTKRIMNINFTDLWEIISFKFSYSDAWNCPSLNSTTLHLKSLCWNALHYNIFPCTTLHFRSLHSTRCHAQAIYRTLYITAHQYTTIMCKILHFTSGHSTTRHSDARYHTPMKDITVHSTSQNNTTLPCKILHCTSLHSSTLPSCAGYLNFTSLHNTR